MRMRKAISIDMLRTAAVFMISKSPHRLDVGIDARPPPKDK